MSSLVICFSGRIGSGKTSVSRGVADSLQAPWTGFGDFVRTIADHRSLDAESRDVLQALGEKLIRERGTAWFCQQVVARANWNGVTPLVIDGVRHVAVLDEIVRQISPHRVVLIHLSLPDTAAGRGIDPEVRRIVERHSTEADVVALLPARAHLVLATEPPVEAVVERVVRFLWPLLPVDGH